MQYTYALKTLRRASHLYKRIRNSTYYVDQQELFSGLREGLKLMKEGESVTFIFPSQKAYGYYGDDNKIGSNVPLDLRRFLIKTYNN